VVNLSLKFILRIIQTTVLKLESTNQREGGIRVTNKTRATTRASSYGVEVAVFELCVVQNGGLLCCFCCTVAALGTFT
jgi:hypothetical protein